MSILSQAAFTKLSERLSTSTQWDQVKSYCLQDQQYDSLRQEILTRLGSLVDDIPAVGGNFRSKCEAIVRVQECLYDLQLVEHVSKVPTLGVAKLVMAMDKRRAVKRVQTCKWMSKEFGYWERIINCLNLAKPPRKSGFSAAKPAVQHPTGTPSSASANNPTTSGQRRRYGPASSLSPTFNASGGRDLVQKSPAGNTRGSEEPVIAALTSSRPKIQSPNSSSTGSGGKRGNTGGKMGLKGGGHHVKHTPRRSVRTAVWEKEKPSFHHQDHQLHTGVDEEGGDDDSDEEPSPPKLAKKQHAATSRSSLAARKNAKTSSASASTAQQRQTVAKPSPSGGGASSPRKRTPSGKPANSTAGNSIVTRRKMLEANVEESSSSDDDDDDGIDAAGEDEPTYCVCKRISFGEWQLNKQKEIDIT